MSSTEDALKWAAGLSVAGSAVGDRTAERAKELAAEVRALRANIDELKLKHRKEINEMIREYELKCRDAYRQGCIDERFALDC